MGEPFNPEWLKKTQGWWRIDWMKATDEDHDLIDALIDREVLTVHPVAPPTDEMVGNE
jgi:hypothetical protein